jgi:hypothetical protein
MLVLLCAGAPGEPCHPARDSLRVLADSPRGAADGHEVATIMMKFHAGCTALDLASGRPTQLPQPALATALTYCLHPYIMLFIGGHFPVSRDSPVPSRRSESAVKSPTSAAMGRQRLRSHGAGKSLIPTCQ